MRGQPFWQGGISINPQWLIAVASSVLAVTTIVIAFVTAKYAASAQEQAAQTSEMVATMRLDQRPWLGYSSFAVQARESPDVAWENRKSPSQGEDIRALFFLDNIGKTPALNVQRIILRPKMVAVDGQLPDEPNGWLKHPDTIAIFPNIDNAIWHTGDPFRLTQQEFSEYSSKSKRMFFWAKLFYCDAAGQRYWTQVGIAHEFGASGFNIRSVTVGDSEPGAEDHPGCE